MYATRPIVWRPCYRPGGLVGGDCYINATSGFQGFRAAIQTDRNQSKKGGKDQESVQ